MKKIFGLVNLSLLIVAFSASVSAQTLTEVEVLRSEIAALKASHEDRILMLEAKLEEIADAKTVVTASDSSADLAQFMPTRPVIVVAFVLMTIFWVVGTKHFSRR